MSMIAVGAALHTSVIDPHLPGQEGLAADRARHLLFLAGLTEELTPNASSLSWLSLITGR